MSAEFLRPEFFWLLVPLFVALVLLYFKKKLKTPALLLRSALFALLVVALADPIEELTESKTELTALFDVSHSISQAGRDALLKKLSLYKNQSLKLLPFAGEAAKEPLFIKPGTKTETLKKLLKKSARKIDTGETNFAHATKQVLSEHPSSSLLLLSDGYETSGNIKKALEESSFQNVRIFPLVPSQESFVSKALSLSTLHAPITVGAGDRAEIRAALKNTQSSKQEGILEIWFGKQKLKEEKIVVPPGEERLLLTKTPPTTGGLHRIRAVLKTPDGREELSEKHRWISVKQKAKVLLLSGTKDDERIIGKVLQLKGYALESIVADGRKKIPISFENYSSILLNNAAKKQLPKAFLPALKSFVEEGGGLALIGGDRSFGLGEYKNTVLEEISPLHFLPPQTKKRRLNSAVVLIIDKSRSMLQQNKILAAKRAALTAIDALKPDDSVSVIGFDSTPFVIIRLDLVSRVKPIAERRLRNLTAAGKTNLLPALAQARQALRRSKASRKHIIILSDGKFPQIGNQYSREISELESAGVTISTVALGVEADKAFMKMLARSGKGAFYETLDPSQLPEIFLRDIKVSVGEKTLKEQSDFLVQKGPGGIFSTSLENYPILRGFVETRAKKEARLELVTRKKGRSHPILASWKFGRGHVVAFTSDANGRWSNQWRRWQGFGKFWGDVLESIKNRSSEKSQELDFDLRYHISGKTISFDLVIFDEKLRTQSPPQIVANVLEPGGEIKKLFFRSSKRGRFETSLQNGRPGDYRLEIAYGEITLPPVAVTLPGDVFGEKPGRGLQLQTLLEIAKQSGGVINPSLEQVKAPPKITKEQKSLVLPLLLLAFALVLLEAFVRERN